jgi:hypothetical protein
MIPYRLLAQPQLGRDRRVGPALGDQIQHLPFPVGQLRETGGGTEALAVKLDPSWTRTCVALVLAAEAPVSRHACTPDPACLPAARRPAAVGHPLGQPPIQLLWVPTISSTSRDQAIFVDHATGASLPSYAVLAENDRLW